MRIAVVSHVRHPVSPPFMGGMEAHSWHLVRALAARGHDVTLFASGDSDAGVPLWPILESHYDEVFPWHRWRGTDALNAHVDAGFTAAGRALLDGGFDVVHNNSLHRFPPRLARARRLAMVTSLHVPPFDALQRAVRDSAAPWSRFTVPSTVQRRAWWPEGHPEEAIVLPNGIDLADWPYTPEGGSHAVWAGRITATKAPHVAAAAAIRAGLELAIFGKIENRNYFDEVLRPWLGSRARYGGHLSPAELAHEFGRAGVLLFTPNWDEPFGLVAIEAMAAGTPVAAIDIGAVREVVGEAGALTPSSDAADLAAAVAAALAVPRRIARSRVERHFTIERMCDGYEAEYRRARAGLSAAREAIRFKPWQLSVATRPSRPDDSPTGTAVVPATAPPG